MNGMPKLARKGHLQNIKCGGARSELSNWFLPLITLVLVCTVSDSFQSDHTHRYFSFRELLFRVPINQEGRKDKNEQIARLGAVLASADSVVLDGLTLKRYLSDRYSIERSIR